MVGKIKDETGSFTIGLVVIGSLSIVSMLVALSLRHDAELEQAVELPDQTLLRAAAD